MTKWKGVALAVLTLTCGSVMFLAATSSARPNALPSWCGPKKISLGLTDGFDAPVYPRWPLDSTATSSDYPLPPPPAGEDRVGACDALSGPVR